MNRVAHCAVSLRRATPDTAPLLANLLELYIHELSAVFPVTIGSDGRFGYDKLPLYWTEPETRHPFLITCGGDIAGFALAVRGLPASAEPGVMDVAEFFVLRALRRAGVGSRAAAALWDQFPGPWTVRVAEANAPALSFWRDAVASYTAGAFSESQRREHPHTWRVFHFVSPEESRNPESAKSP